MLQSPFDWDDLYREDQMKAAVNGITLAYDDHGQGLPVVFLHAFPFNRRMWQSQAAALADRFRIITVDLRGHGESDAPLWHYTLDSYADDVAALLDHLAIQRAVLVGLSMGGYLSFAFHRKYPGRVSGLVLADTRAEADKPQAAAWRFALAQRAYRDGAKAVFADMGPKLLSPSAYTGNPALVRQVEELILSAPVSGIACDLMAMAERPHLAQIACPTLVLVGAEDQLTSPEENRRIAEGITGATFEILAGAGHMSNLERPEAFNRALGEFLGRLRN
jgi:3-oxoadipate enol-lactonase